MKQIKLKEEVKMSKIHIKMLSEDALIYLKKNSDVVAKNVNDQSSNEWIYKTFPQPMFIEKKFEIEDFELVDNPDSNDKEIDFNNSIKIYNCINNDLIKEVKVGKEPTTIICV
jgi:hypothetical protein